LPGDHRNREDAGGKTTILFWHSFVSSTVPALNELLEKFQKDNLNITIKAQYIPTGDALIQKLITAVQSKTAPDISWSHADVLPSLTEANAVYRMKESVRGPDGLTEADLSDFFPVFLEAASWRDTLYSMPMKATNWGTALHKALFRNTGLDPERHPQTWDELRSYAKKLTIDKNNDGKFDPVGFGIPVYPASGQLGSWMVWQWMTFLWQAGGYNINLEQTEVLFNSDAGVKSSNTLAADLS